MPRKSKNARLTAEQQRLVAENMALVGHMLTRYLRPTPTHDELRSSGYLALCRAAIGFDSTKGCRFSTYACCTIAREWWKEARRLEKIADRGVGDTGGEGWADGRDSTEEEDRCRREEIRAVRRAVGKLEPRRKLVIERRLEGRTLEAIGEELGVTRERARQIEKHAKADLHASLAREGAMSCA